MIGLKLARKRTELRRQNADKNVCLQSVIRSLPSCPPYSTFSTFTEFVEPFDKRGIPAVYTT